MRPSEEMKSRRRRTSKGRVLLGFGGLAIFLFFTSIRGLAGFWTDYLWFDSLALSSVWTSVLWAKIGLGLLFTAIWHRCWLLCLPAPIPNVCSQLGFRSDSRHFRRYNHRALSQWRNTYSGTTWIPGDTSGKSSSVLAVGFACVG